MAPCRTCSCPICQIARARLYAAHRGYAPDQVLGDIDLESIARSIAETQTRSRERKRLYHEATAFLKLRAERLKWARQGVDSVKPMVSVPSAPSSGGND